MNAHRFILRPAIRIIGTACCLHAALAGCDDDPGPPPDEPKKSQHGPTVDTVHSAAIQADRRFSIPNVVLVLQTGSADSAEISVSLTTAQPGPDGSRMIFGTFEKAKTFETLKGRAVLFVGSGSYVANQNGILTPFTAYKPKSATMTITQLDDKEARGTLAGEFYRWPLPTAIAARPTVVDLTMGFTAEVIIR